MKNERKGEKKKIVKERYDLKSSERWEKKRRERNSEREIREEGIREKVLQERWERKRDGDKIWERNNSDRWDRKWRKRNIKLERRMITRRDEIERVARDGRESKKK